MIIGRSIMGSPPQSGRSSHPGGRTGHFLDRAAIARAIALARSAAADAPDWLRPAHAEEREPLGWSAHASDHARVPEHGLDVAREDPNPTMNTPYLWAWQTFVQINRPGKVNG